MAFNKALDQATELYLEQDSDHELQQALRYLDMFLEERGIRDVVEVYDTDNQVVIVTPRYEFTLSVAGLSESDPENEEDDDPMDAAEDIASEYEDLSDEERQKYDRISGNAGKKSQNAVRDYGKFAVQGASKTLNLMKKTISSL